jgi:hypothetical protein
MHPYAIEGVFVQDILRHYAMRPSTIRQRIQLLIWNCEGFYTPLGNNVFVKHLLVPFGLVSELLHDIHHSQFTDE